jgi:hypothetical protein
MTVEVQQSQVANRRTRSRKKIYLLKWSTWQYNSDAVIRDQLIVKNRPLGTAWKLGAEW